MFDYVDTDGPVPCPACGKPVTGFQSKDLDCMLDKVHWTKVSRFYSSCVCGEWIEYRREQVPESTPRFAGYELVRRP